MEKTTDWIIIEVDSDAGDFFVDKVSCDDELRIKKYLAERVRELKRYNSECFDTGSTRISDIEEVGEGRFKAYANFEEYHIDILAIQANVIEPMEIK